MNIQRCINFSMKLIRLSFIPLLLIHDPFSKCLSRVSFHPSTILIYSAYQPLHLIQTSTIVSLPSTIKYQPYWLPVIHAWFGQILSL